MNFKFVSTKTLDGIKYKLLAEEQIRDYVNEIAIKEWSSQDFRKYGNDLWQSKWKLKVVPLNKIKLNQDLLQTKEFKKDLIPRIEKMKEIIGEKEAIPPLILRGSDFLIFDGYARFKVLRRKRITRCLAYVGE